ncbi:MAG: hypothetical protein OEY91_15480, partial [Nitrospirota bacterium]|nr:hypothetical protein [Nitrospirota bacterium]
MRVLFFLVLVMWATHAFANANEGTTQNTPVPEAFTDLNLRFSNRPLRPPDNIIVQTIPLTVLSVAQPFVAPAPQAVIFEDDQRQRLAILSTGETGHLTLFLLQPLPLDPSLPRLVQCANNRSCQTDRTPLTGGLGCLALCLNALLETPT